MFAVVVIRDRTHEMCLDRESNSGLEGLRGLDFGARGSAGFNVGEPCLTQECQE